MPKEKTKVIVILGPTASGKTKLAVKLASQVKGEIISADSRQIYKGLNIGSGKDLVEYGDIPYYLVDILDPAEKYSSAKFQSDAMHWLKVISKKKRIPIICGGTAFYVKALLDNYEFSQVSVDFSQSQYLESLPREELYNKIKKLGSWNDRPWIFDSKRRMSKAIEKATNQSPQNRSDQSFTKEFTARIYYTSVNRDCLRSRILYRLNQRLEEGLIEEVTGLLDKGISFDFLESLGLEYRWICRYLNSELSFEDMKEKLFTDICRFAKRQKTFLRYMQKQGHEMKEISSWDTLCLDVEKWLAMPA